MLDKIYFCLFCPQKFNTNDENKLKKHLISSHFECKRQPIVEEWIESLVNYQTELNQCLSSEPKSLPESSMCQSSHGKQKLLKGCTLCDKIIQSFKLDINLVNKRRNVCICGEGKEVNKVVVICIQCKHMYHYSCVEPTDYSGEEISLYKCLKCKQKDFEISDLSSESKILQPLHVSLHFKYQPFVCKVSRIVNGISLGCNESFFRQNFLKTHLKSEHKLTINESEIEKYYKLHSIPKVQHLIDSSLKKLSENNSSHQLIGPTAAQSSSAQNRRISPELTDNLGTNKRIRTETGFRSVSSTGVRGSGEHRISGSNQNHNFNVSLGPPPVIEPVSTHYRSKSAPRSPPILVNQSNFDSNFIQTNNQNNSQMTKRGRGRPKGSKSKKANNKSGHSSGSNGRKLITPNCYVADGNPQLKSRLSEKSRLSRPNISLSREQERELKFRRNQTKDNKNTSFALRSDSSDLDSDTEMYETPTMRRSEPLTFESSNNQYIDNDILSHSDENFDEEVSEQHIRRLSSSSKRSPNKEPSLPNQTNASTSCSTNTVRIESISPTVPVFESTQCISPVNEEMSSVQQTLTEEEEEVVIPNNDSDLSDNNQPISGGTPVLVTQLTRVEDNQMENIPLDNEMISNSPEMYPQNEVEDQQVMNQTTSYSDWLTHTKPKKFPYFPQINDEVVYIPYGHRLYVKAVKDLKLYRQTNPTKYISDEKYIKEIIFAKVRDIKFEKHKNVRLTRLTLRLIDNNIETKQMFYLKFHDIDNVLDFIILKQTYENSLMRNWKINDSFRAIIEDKWWFGEIRSYNINENCLKNHFQSLSIVWGNGMTDFLSYWDLEPIIGEIPQNKKISIDVTDEDRAKFYVSERQEWPEYGKEEECKRISEGLTQVMQLNEYKQLMEVLKPTNSEYVDRVPYLINLSIVRSRVQNMFYRRHAAVKYDIKLLESNIEKFLDPTGAKGVLENARIVISVCLKFIDEHRTKTIEHIYNKVMRDPNILTKIKYYSCSRPYLNTNPNAVNPLIASTCAQIFGFNGSDLSMNILTPSTTRPIVNTIRRSNDSEISLIELSDDSDEENTEERPQQRIQEMVDQMNDYVVSPTPPDSPPSPAPSPTPVQSVAQPIIQSTQSGSQNSRPVVTVRAQPIDNRITTAQQQQSSDQLIRYFCIVPNCGQKFVDRNEAIDHYFDELNIKLKCYSCPLNTSFESFEDYFNHNSKHKKTINSKTYLNTKTWIEKMIEYMDSLIDPITAQNQIDQKYGDCCAVCQMINTLTPDSQPFFHKRVFANNRVSMKSTVREEVEFTQHMRKHLMYEPVYKCTPCFVSDPQNVFTSATIDENCRKHLENKHNIQLHSTQASDVTPFFGNNKIPIIDNIIPDAVNEFIFYCSNW